MNNTAQAHRLSILFRATILVLLSLLIALSGWAFYLLTHGTALLASGPAGLNFPKNRYYAVYVSGGQLFFGQFQTVAGSSFAVLTNVFYVQNQQNEQTKQVSTMLVRRGKEWHQPDRMYLNTSQIVLIEPVGDASRVAQLISEATH